MRSPTLNPVRVAVMRACYWLDGYRGSPRRSRLRPWRRVWPRFPQKSRRTLWVEWHVCGVRWPTESGRFQA